MKKNFIYVIMIFNVIFCQQDLLISMDQPDKDEEMVINLSTLTFKSIENIFYAGRKQAQESRLSDLFAIEQYDEFSNQDAPTTSPASVLEYENLIVQAGQDVFKLKMYIDDAVETQEEQEDNQLDVTLSVQIVADKCGMYDNNLSNAKKHVQQSNSSHKKKKKSVKNTVQNNKSQIVEKDLDLEYLDLVIAEQQENSSKNDQKILKKNEYRGVIRYMNGQKKYSVDIKNFGQVVCQSFLDMADLVPSYIDNPKKFLEDSDVEYWDVTGCPFVLEALVDYVKFNKENSLEVINHFLTWQIQDNLYTYHDIVLELPASRRKNLQLSFINQMELILKDATSHDIASLIIQNQTNLKSYIEDMFDLMNRCIDNHMKNIEKPHASTSLWKSNGQPFVMKALQLYVAKDGEISQKMFEGIAEYQLKIARHKLHFRKNKSSLHYIKAQEYNDFACIMENMITKKA